MVIEEAPYKYEYPSHCKIFHLSMNCMKNEWILNP